MNDFMLDSIKLFNPDSKLWIFQSLDSLDEKEVLFISNNIEQFLSSWKSHGKQIKSTSFIIKSHFIFVLVDSNFVEASGCSIDNLFKKIQEIGNYLNKDFLKRNLISFKKKQSKRINFFPLIKFKEYMNSHDSNDFIIFDNSICLLRDLQYWQMNVLDWKLKYFK